VRVFMRYGNDSPENGPLRQFHHVCSLTRLVQALQREGKGISEGVPTSPSHFAQVFRRVVGVTPTEFRNAFIER